MAIQKKRLSFLDASSGLGIENDSPAFPPPGLGQTPGKWLARDSWLCIDAQQISWMILVHYLAPHQ